MDTFALLSVEHVEVLVAGDEIDDIISNQWRGLNLVSEIGDP